jgi:hypothetical protein
MTLSETYTPSLPTEAIATIQTPIGPDSLAVFSPITFSTTTKDGVVADPVTSFNVGVTHIFGGFSYDKMVMGVQWTAVWLYQGKVIFLETKPWNYTPGGYGYTDASCLLTNGCPANTRCRSLSVPPGKHPAGSRLWSGTIPTSTTTPAPGTPVIGRPPLLRLPQTIAPQ